MEDRIVDRARENRTAALGYVEDQKRRLDSIVGRPMEGTAPRTPIPNLGFSSSRREQTRKAALEAV